MLEKIRKEYFKVQQGGFEFYTFIIDSKTLREITYVSRRESKNPKGYQRYLSDKRLKDVGEYIKKPRATFPNSIIINLNSKKIRIEPAASNPNHGTIIIQKEEDVAWIIDGQHRLYGFEHSDGKEFDLLVAAYSGLNISDQATIFKIINSNQKGVSLSLIYDLIDLTKDAEYLDERGHEIVKALNEDNDSPWKMQIKMLGMGKGIISQAAFIGSLKKVLRDNILKEYPVGEQIKILKDYFCAFKDLFPDAWVSKKHVLCKTLGVAAILLIISKVLIHCRIKNNFTKQTMKDILKDLPSIEIPTEIGYEVIDFSGKQLGAFGGRQGQHKLADMLESALPPLRPSS